MFRDAGKDERRRARRNIEKLEDAGLIGRGGEGALGGDALAVELREVLGVLDDEAEEGRGVATADRGWLMVGSRGSGQLKARQRTSGPGCLR